MNNPEKIQFQDRFFRKAGKNLQTLKFMMDKIPDIGFYIKDREGRIVSFNKRNCEISNLKNEFEAIGSRSKELFPAVKSAVYTSQDDEVVRTGEPLTDITHTHSVDGSMRTVHKNIYPVYSASGKQIIGTVCFYRQEDEIETSLDWHGCIKAITSHINSHYVEPLTCAALARIGNTTPSKLTRAFLRILEVTPSQYVTNVRINAARKLLENTQKTIAEIASECGFCDHSHLVHTFRRIRGETPGEYRLRHQGITSAQ